ncbi:MAG: HAMP domain-containing histidine kinase [Proteobacteria bacterium]|nr:HAMP domain-containing histidine kinase [Pseudomonadota bacterium]MBU1581920.1 HAMP domain-containing histidine kinase [Pseudomonadota bacterium]MBU2630138.1 HAMP domain-containing histidine kinase [Pseudomonadota bacterium]
MKTEFASPERALPEKLISDIHHARNLPLVRELTQLISDAFAILNTHRQIIYCNATLINVLGIDDPEKIYGLRLGEALNCIHSNETESGCGTTAFCKYCGAVNAMVKSQNEPDTLKEEEFRLVAGKENQSFDFRIRAKTLELLNGIFTVVIVNDISNEKRRNVLERIFFHDILNTAGGIQGLIGLMKEATEEELEEYLHLAESSSEILIEEINAQREILAAENENLETKMSRLNSLDILSSVIAVYKNHQVAEGKSIKISDKAVSMNFISDPRLLIRIIGNMVKNALEAETAGQVVTIGSIEKNKKIQFWVHNPKVMPEEVKLQIFQRSFSTKGSGRGLGTYSIKLLGERYLKGEVKFESQKDQGTIFSVELPII